MSRMKHKFADCFPSLFQCCVCMAFGCDSMEELVAHVDADRSASGPRDVTMRPNDFTCHLCQYRSNLKANFQLHLKTEKHTQKLQLVSALMDWIMETVQISKIKKVLLLFSSFDNFTDQPCPRRWSR